MEYEDDETIVDGMMAFIILGYCFIYFRLHGWL